MSTRILLVEDEPGIVQVIIDLLESESQVEETAADGDAGPELVCSGFFGTLLLDVILPDTPGWKSATAPASKAARVS